MDNSKIVFLINDQVRLIRVTYEPGTPEVEKQAYSFKTLDQSIQVDDYVVVETGTRHGLTVCKVVAVDLDVNFDDGIPLKWAFQCFREQTRSSQCPHQSTPARSTSSRASLS